jgi:hypothetical protein
MLLTKHERDLLYVRTTDAAVRVLGRNAELDANALQKAGVRVHRSPQD